MSRGDEADMKRAEETPWTVEKSQSAVSVGGIAVPLGAVVIRGNGGYVAVLPEWCNNPRIALRIARYIVRLHSAKPLERRP